MNKVPNLRFKEFNENWNIKKLGQLGESIIGLTYSPDNIVELGTLVLRSSNIKDNKIVYLDNVYVDMDIPEKLITIENDVLICSRNGSRALIGKSALIGKDHINNSFGAFMTIFRSDYGAFIFQLIQTQSFFKQIHQNLGATINQITSKDLNNMKFYIPKNEEKIKIGAFFSLIDKKIELQTERVEELKSYKKGIIQKIFSQELRFKDENGNEYPEWEEVNLRNILEEVSKKTSVINQYEVISSTNNGLYLQKDYFNREIASKDNIGYKILKRNQVVLSPQNLWMGNINLNSKYDIGMVSPSYKIFDIKSDFDSSYIGFVLRTDRAFYEYKQASEQGASIVRRNLNMDLFYDIGFKLPCKAEQYKISKFINKLDCKIEQEMEKLNSLNQYKKGLLQQMFI